MAALAIAWQVNTSMCRPEKPVSVHDFMPSKAKRKKLEPLKTKNKKKQVNDMLFHLSQKILEMKNG